MSMVFGGYIVDADGYRHQLKAIMDPEELDVRGVLTSIGKGSGVIKMRCEPESEGRPYELALYFESENFLLMLSEYDKDGEHVVRTMTNLNSKNELVSILGEMYTSRAVTHDVEIVCAIFIEFARSGNVSVDIMA
ncbi:hypothetical protein SFA35_16615 [Pseudomonas sp. HR96]|uniref:DUF6911 family protein n=1 Tax=Pseudomonas sp. HR96 TaxID=1027966 RepID=UPI002A755726|nr:hypothetical protein [Pseudomonas sp. HR96]WPO98263.1 hypothetical protein SFA35_16615 [Pseudomonas sp. HR96]